MNYLNKIYNVGLYIRLSREDDKTLESESIKNQKSLLLQYVNDNHLNLYDIYIDDGYSGTTFDRPSFNRLIKDIETNKVNMVITKDMSRLGRDYIGTGNLIEKYFPEHGVRYIAVIDNIDTLLDSEINDITPFKATMNDMYAKDISQKIKSSLKAKQKDGKWVGGKTPFGYIKDPKNKNHLIISEEQACVVKRIFKMALDGLTFFKIAKKLTLDGVKTPGQYYYCEQKNINFGKWHPKSIKDILTNRNYTGDLVQNRRRKINYKVKKIVKNDPSQYIVVLNTHEAIIDRETFTEVQKKIPKNVGRSEKKEHNLLDGLLYCGDCGHRISVQPRRKNDNRCYTICNYYRTYMKEKLCTSHCNNYDQLEQTIINFLKINYLNFIDKNKIMDNIKEKLNSLNAIDNNKQTINLFEQKINQINNNLDIIYLDKVNNIITEEQFNRVKVKLQSELNLKKAQLHKLKKENQNKKADKKKEEILNRHIRNFLEMKKISRELVINLIEKIEIFKDERINVTLNFKNIA